MTAAPDTMMPYNPRLDGLRCIAILGVLPMHFITGSALLSYVDTGNLGVKLFFVLSGYLITSILLGYRERVDKQQATVGRALLVFYARRMLRLSPLYYAYLLLALLLLPGVRDYLGWFLSYLQNFLFAVKPDVYARHLAHLWTLAVEEQFYLVAPMLLLLTPRRWALGLVIGFVATGIVFRAAGTALGFEPFSVAMMMPAQMDTLGMGALLAVLRRQPGRRKAADRLVRWGLIIGLPLTLACHAARALDAGNAAAFVVENFALGLLFVSLIGSAASAVPPPGFRLLELTPLVFLGRISYGIYICHFNVPGLLRDLVFPGLGLALPGSETLRFLLFTATSIAIAAASFYLYERRFNRLKDAFVLRPAGSGHYSHRARRT